MTVTIMVKRSNISQSAEREEPQNAEVPYLIARSYADMMNYKLAIPYFDKGDRIGS
jgi:hypothetical protein